MTKRRKYSPEFKADAVRLVVEQGYSVAEAGRSLGINANMLGRWIKEQSSDEPIIGNGKLTEDQRQIRELKQRVKQLEMEKEILKNHPRYSLQQKRSENTRLSPNIRIPTPYA